MEGARKGLRESVAPQLWGRAVLAAGLAQLDDIAEARRVMTELVSRRPEFTLGFTREHYPQTNPEYMDHFIDGLRKAGVPE